jgi:hypothetical protein
MEDDCSPLFIISAPRSFTSLMAAMLGQHPEAYGVPDLNLFLEDTLQELVVSMTDIYANQLHGLLRTVAELYAGEQTMAAIDMAHRWIVKRKDWPTGEVYKELSRRVAPLRIVDKSPGYISRERLQHIRRVFPDAYYLHLIRHPFNMCESLMKHESGQIIATLTNSLDYSTTDEVIDPQFLWYRTNHTICRFLDNVNDRQKMQLRVEDFLNDPKHFCKILCHWLGWSWDSACYEAMLHPEDSIYANSGPFGANLGNNPDFIKAPRFRQQPIITGNLSAILPWRPDKQGFYPHVIEMASRFGYK